MRETSHTNIKQPSIMVESTRDVREVFSQLEEETGKLGLQVNEEKMKYMVVTRKSKTRIKQNVSLNEYNFDLVRPSKYLDAIITDDNQGKDVSARIRAGNRALFPLTTSKLLNRQSKQTL